MGLVSSSARKKMTSHKKNRGNDYNPGTDPQDKSLPDYMKRHIDRMSETYFGLKARKTTLAQRFHSLKALKQKSYKKDARVWLYKSSKSSVEYKDDDITIDEVKALFSNTLAPAGVYTNHGFSFTPGRDTYEPPTVTVTECLPDQQNGCLENNSSVGKENSQSQQNLPQRDNELINRPILKETQGIVTNGQPHLQTISEPIISITDIHVDDRSNNNNINGTIIRPEENGNELDNCENNQTHLVVRSSSRFYQDEMNSNKKTNGLSLSDYLVFPQNMMHSCNDHSISDTSSVGSIPSIPALPSPPIDPLDSDCYASDDNPETGSPPVCVVNVTSEDVA